MSQSVLLKSNCRPENIAQWIELVFPLTGNKLPIHHGYPLYSAICHHVPTAHSDKHFRLNTIAGTKFDEDSIMVSPESRLRIRLPGGEIAHWLKLAGKELKINQHSIRLGIPTPYTLRPSSTLYARIVTIKNAETPEAFIYSVHQQLDLLQVKAYPQIPENTEQEPKRRILKIKDKTIVGYALLLENLSSEDSLVMQVAGLGGRQRMGAGFFVPATNK